eukprot:bmy_04794T0
MDTNDNSFYSCSAAAHLCLKASSSELEPQPASHWKFRHILSPVPVGSVADACGHWMRSDVSLDALHWTCCCIFQYKARAAVTSGRITFLESSVSVAIDRNKGSDQREGGETEKNVLMSARMPKQSNVSEHSGRMLYRSQLRTDMCLLKMTKFTGSYGEFEGQVLVKCDCALLK